MTRMTFLSDSPASFWASSAVVPSGAAARSWTHEQIPLAAHQPPKLVQDPNEQPSDLSTTPLYQPHDILQENLAQESGGPKSRLSHTVGIALVHLRFE